MRATRWLAVVGAAVFSSLGCEEGGAPAAEPSSGAAAALPAGSAVIYEEALRSGWADWSWGSTRSFANPSPVAAGARSLSVRYGAWGGLYLRRTSASIAGTTTLSLMVNGGSNSGLRLAVAGVRGTTQLPRVDLAPYCAARTIPRNAWTRCQVPLSALGPAGTAFDGFQLQERNGTSHAAAYFDDVGLTGAAPPPPPPPPPVSVAVSPASAAVDGCTGAKFTATVTGAADPSVAWSVQEGAAGGIIDAAGNYTAPTTPGTYHLVARSTASSTAAATATVEVRHKILSIAVDPVRADIAPAGALQLAATITTTCGTYAAR